MSRVQLALNVAELEEAVRFYSKLFNTEPAKRRPGYANFAVADPPLKLVLMEGPAQAARSLNHLGIEVASSEEVEGAQRRLERDGLAPTAQHRTTCCHALQDKIWLSGPGGEPWEVYTVLADVEAPADEVSQATGRAGAAAGAEPAACCC